MLKKIFRFNKTKKIRNDGVFINNGDGSLTVVYSKYDLFKEGDIVKWDILNKSLIRYKSVFIMDKASNEGV